MQSANRNEHDQGDEYVIPKTTSGEDVIHSLTDYFRAVGRGVSISVRTDGPDSPVATSPDAQPRHD